MAEQSSADYRGTLGRYALYGEIASGGMATVHLARLLGPVGFARTVAIKRLHPHLAKDPDFVGMFLEEARLAARVKHPNVVSTLDVVSEDGELFLVMEYVHGESLSRLVRKTREAGLVMSPRHVVGIMCPALEGLHAAHEATSEKGLALGLVHRDVSPQNIHVGLDGVARVLDFGIAKATNRVQETRTDQIKGKVAYMSPEQLAKGNVDRRADVYSASVVLWEALTGQRLFKADDVPSLVYSIINDEVRTPSSVEPGVPKALDHIIMKGLDRESTNRWSSARELAEALERVMTPAPPREIAPWVGTTAGDALVWRQELVNQIESETSTSLAPPEPRHSPVGLETSGVVSSPDDGVEDDERATLTNEARESRSDERETLAQVESQREPEMSVFDPHEAAPRSRASLVAMVLAGVLLVGGAILFGLRWMQMQAEADTPEPASSIEPAITIAGGQRVLPPPSASASASASAGRTSPTVVGTGTSIPVHSGRGTVPDECDNPIIVDSRGIRHPKPQCFKRP